MKRKRRIRGFIAFLIFAAVVTVSGYALNQAGYVDNPFDQIAFLSNWTNGGEGLFEHQFAVNADSSAEMTLPSTDANNTGITLTESTTTNGRFQLPPVSELNGSDADAADSGAPTVIDGPGQSEPEGIAWSDVGDVLYDLWFIAATTAVFIVVQQVFKFSLKQIQSCMPRMAAAK
jgi:hypothetical protein